MSEFVNRVSSDLNKRTLKVLDVTRDEETGEIKSMEVEVSRCDTPTVVGTPLDADVFNQIVRDIIKEEMPLIDAQAKLIAVKDGLSIPQTVTSTTVNMPSYVNGVVITWTTSNPNVISPNGYVYRKHSDEPVTLTANLSYSGYTISKIFSVVVPAIENSERVNLDKNLLSINTTVDSNFSLPGVGSNGSQITWSSSNTEAIEVIGLIAYVTTRNLEQTTVLTATLTYAEATATKTFTVTVLANEPEEEPEEDPEDQFSYSLDNDYYMWDINSTSLLSGTTTINFTGGNGRVRVEDTSGYYYVDFNDDYSSQVTLEIEELSKPDFTMSSIYTIDVFIYDSADILVDRAEITISYEDL